MFVNRKFGLNNGFKSMSALGQKADIRSAKHDVRFTPESGHSAAALGQ
jgi:hypothetical protein